MEDKIFEMVIESMKQKLIFSDMVEMRKIIKGAVKMMEAHYEAKIPSDAKGAEDFLRDKIANNKMDNFYPTFILEMADIMGEYAFQIKPDDNEDKIKDCTTCQFLEVDEAWKCNKCDEYYSNWTKSNQP